jgi:two-component system invasion response regulator UvrY
MTSVLVIDDHPIVLQGCCRLFEDAGIQEVYQASCFSEAFRLYRRHKPDVLVADLAMNAAASGGLAFIRRLRVHDRRTPLLVFSMHSDPVIVSRALALGANGYILKDTAADELISAFHRVRSGQPYVSHELASSIAFGEAHGQSSPLKALTLRELQTLEQIAEGKAYGDIAAELGVSYKTVVNTASVLKTKLSAKSLPELMRIGIRYLPETGSGRKP